MSASCEASSAPRRGRRWARILALQATALCLGLVLSELGHRAWLAARSRPYDRAATEEAVARFLDQSRMQTPRVDLDLPDDGTEGTEQQRWLHPFVGFELARGFRELDLDLQRYREKPANSSEFDLLVLGGSVAAGFAVTGTPRLAERLEADPRFQGRKLHVLNYARGSFKQPQQALYLAYLLALGFRPQAVLNLDGFNEAALGNNNAEHGTSPLFPSWDYWTHLAQSGVGDREVVDLLLAAREGQRGIEGTAERALSLGLCRSSVLGTWTRARLDRLRERTNRAFERYSARLLEHSRTSAIRGPSLPPGEHAAVEQAVGSWFSSSLSIEGMCRQHGIVYVHALQPTLHDTGSKPLTEREIADGAAPEAWIEGVREGYPRMRARGAELAAAGVRFLDQSRAFAEYPGELYFDSCHFRKQGSWILADEIASALLAALLEQR